MKIYTDEEITRKLKKKNLIKKIMNFIIYPIFSVLLIFCISIVLQIIKNPEETPDLFGYKFFNVVSGSMNPQLEIGDIVFSKEIEEKHIKKGDIITFKQKNAIITHRVEDIIIENEKIYYQTKGDNNNSKDESLVQYKDIEGIYVFKIPKIGIFINKIQNTTIMFIVIIVLYIIYKIMKEKDDRKNARHEKRKELEKNKNKK